MHQDFLMIISHLGAQLHPLIRGFNTSSEVSVGVGSIIYTSPIDLHLLRSVCNQNKKAKIVSDILLFNHSLQSTAFSDLCYFLYYLGDPRTVITSLVNNYSYTRSKAYDYYSFRLQRIAAMAKNTPKSMMLTLDSLNDANSKKLAKLLHLKKPVYFSVEAGDRGSEGTGAVADKACQVYNYYSQAMKEVLV